MKKPYKLIFDTGNRSLDPRTTSYATEKAARRALEQTHADLKPYAQIRKLIAEGTSRSELIARGQ